MQLEDFTEGWASVHIGPEGGALSIEGVNPWSQCWRRVSANAIVVPHPSYSQQRHRAWIYEVDGAGKVVQFAATELSNGVWGFYVPTSAAA